MKRSFTSVCAWTIIMVLLTTACKKQTDKYPSDPVSAYMNLQVGKYVRYRLDSTIYVFFLQIDESLNVPIPSPDVSASRNYWIEKYARGIGLVYKEVVMWEYQPSSGPNPGYFNGFGLKMTILDHN